MLTLNNRIKKFLVENCEVDAKATDADIRVAAGAALAEGKGGFTFQKYQELLKDVGDSDDESAPSGEKSEDTEIVKLLKGLSSRMDKIEKGSVPAQPEGNDYEDDSTFSEDFDPLKHKTGGVKSRFEQMLTGLSFETTKGKMLSARGANENYGTEKSAAHFPEQNVKGVKHHHAGKKAFEGQRTIDNPSELEMAINGAYGKFMIAQSLGEKCPRHLKLTEHEQGLVQYALAECKWVGIIGGKGQEDEGAQKVKNRKLKPSEVKAILDDSVSGGLEITPIFFDDAVILTPILFGEFSNRINMVPITRGRRIEGASISNVTLGQSTEGAAISLFNTAGFISAFDTTIYVVAGAIEIGLDEMSDSPVDIGGIVTGQYGRKLLEWLDNVVCDGDGTTEPEGIIQASGTVSVNHSSAAPTVGGYESLLFGIAKKYKQGYDTSRICFGGTETSYQRSRAIAVGAADARRVFGLNQENYMLFGHHYGVNEQLANTEIFFGNLGRYRMYRRMGLTFNATTEGKELVLNNEMLLSCRARFGGQIEDGNAFAVVTDGQA